MQVNPMEAAKQKRAALVQAKTYQQEAIAHIEALFPAGDTPATLMGMLQDCIQQTDLEINSLDVVLECGEAA